MRPVSLHHISPQHLNPYSRVFNKQTFLPISQSDWKNCINTKSTLLSGSVNFNSSERYELNQS